MKVAFVFNPTAQTGVAARRWDEIERVARELDIDFERFDTRPDGATVSMAAELAASRRYGTIVAFGGDGTISEVVCGMMSAGVPRDALASLAVVPFGTGNNIAKSFNISSAGVSLRKAIETVVYGADLRMDLGRIDDRWFADGFSIGVDPAILHERNTEREKARRSPLLRSILRDYNLYAYAMMRVPFKHRNVAATIELCDGHVMKIAHLTNLVVNNVRVYAGEFVFDPDSRANDGLLDVIVFTGWRDYLSKFIVAARMSPINPRVLAKVLKRRGTFIKVPSLVVTTAVPVDSQVDGEVFKRASRFEIFCVRDALTLKIPVG